MEMAAVPPASAARTSPSTIASTIRPSTSSTMAAPRMTRDSRASVTPRSLSTRAVMPTLVAARLAPRNRWTYHPASGMKREETA